jgi:poly-gamma-glutamate synthesis protein (capsule biosynthesis protein)
MHMAENELVLMGCGDIGPVHEPMNAYGTLAAPILAAGDVRFAQCERVYSNKGIQQIHIDHIHNRCEPHMASVFSDCHFDVVSIAGNHSMDWGADAFTDMMAVFESRGIKTVGGGRNIEEARQPAVFERNGVRIAILAYCSAFHQGYAATGDKPGIAPLRAHTYYEAHDDQPGVPPRVISFPYPEDLQAMEADIARAKKAAHAVVVSFHWGVHFIPRLVADYQRITAKAAFDAGADLILGHHPHIPKAIEMFGTKACFYSLGTFIMSANSKPDRAARFKERFGVDLDPEYPLLPFGMDSKYSLIAKAVFSKQGLKRVSYLPVLIDTQLRPQVLKRSDARFQEVVDYLSWASEGFNCRPSAEGDEIVLT